MKRPTTDCETASPRSTADDLRMKKTAILREANARARELDRHINMLESTDAENVLAEAKAALENV